MSGEMNGEFSMAQIADAAMADLRHRAAFPLIVRDGDFIVLIDRLEDGTEHERYDVPVDQLSTAAGTAFWMRQLAPKNWVTKKHLELLAQAVIDLNEATGEAHG